MQEAADPYPHHGCKDLTDHIAQDAQCKSKCRRKLR